MDNSDWTRNGDYHPDRWTSQVEAANLLAENRSERNPENGIGIISMAGKRVQVHVTLTNDLSRILNSVKEIHLSGECDFVTSMNIATLTLKHRQNKSQKQRIILFVGSPIRNSVEDMTNLGKKLKKYNVAVDVISFGNVDQNRDILKAFYESVNNSNNSSILEVPVGFYLMDSLFSSSLMSEAGGFGDFPMEDTNVNNTNQNNNQSTSNINRQGGMTQFERDINLAIQQSLEEERKKQEAQETNSTLKNNDKTNNQNVEMTPVQEENEEEELEKARLLSLQEHQKIVKKEKDEEQKVKDELLENQDFIKDILKGIGNTDIKDDEVEEVLKKIKEDKAEKEKKDGNEDKDNKEK